MRMPILMCLALLPCAASRGVEETLAVTASPAAEADLEGYERGEWQAEAFDNPIKVEAVRPNGQEANRMLRVTYFGGNADKSVAKRLTTLGLAEKGSLRAQVFLATPAKPPKVALALCTGTDYTWQETKPVELKEGWNEIKVELDAQTWKSASTEWKHTAELQNRGDVRAIELIVYSGKESGVVYLDALKADLNGQSEDLLKLIAQLGDADFAKREAAERALIEVGPRALACLRDAADGNDAEASLRIKRLIDTITKPAKK